MTEPKRCVTCNQFIDREEIENDLAEGFRDKEGELRFRHTYKCDEPAENDDPDEGAE
jgi:hypothetical protein